MSKAKDRTRQAQALLTDEEMAALDALAARNDVCRAQYLRFLIRKAIKEQGPLMNTALPTPVDEYLALVARSA